MVNYMRKRYIAPLIILCTFTGTIQLKAQAKYSLDDCKKMAVENNRTIKNSRLEIEAAKQTKKNAFTGYFPKVSATGMGFRFNDPIIEYTLPGGNLPVYDGNPANLPGATQFAYFPDISLSLLDKANIAAVTAVQPLYAGGRIVTGNKLAQLGVNVNHSRLILSKSEVLLQTEEQYWGIVSLNEKLRTLHMAERLLDTVYKQANDSYRAGLINRNDVMKVSIKQSEMRMSRLKLENGIKLATMAFSQHIGLAYDSTMVLADTLVISQNPYEVYMDADQAVINREEYKLLQKGVEAEELQTRLKIGEYLPEVGVGVGTVYYDYDFSNNKGTSNTMVFASVKIPISDWWGASHAIKEKKFKEQIARNNSQNNSELLLLQVQKAWNELNEAYKQIDVANEIVAQAEENLRINSDNYKNGIVNISDMIEAQTILQQTRDELTDARSGYKIKLVTYLQVTGRYEL